MKIETIYCDICGDVIEKDNLEITGNVELWQSKSKDKDGRYWERYDDVCNPCTNKVSTFIQAMKEEQKHDKN